MEKWDKLYDGLNRVASDRQIQKAYFKMLKRKGWKPLEEMTLPIRHGCNLHIICKYPNTEDQKIFCRFVDATDKLIFEEVKVFDAWSLSKVIRRCYKTLNEENTKHGLSYLNDV